MYHRLPSTFLEIPKRLKSDFLRVSKRAASDVHADLKMNLEIATALKYEEWGEQHPQTADSLTNFYNGVAKKMRSHYFGLALRSELANPYMKLVVGVPLILVGCVNPIPGDITLGLVLLSSTRRQIKRGFKEIMDEIDGTIKQRQFQDALSCVTDRSDPQKHIILNELPIYSQN